jgi:hypothetical protein
VLHVKENMSQKLTCMREYSLHVLTSLVCPEVTQQAHNIIPMDYANGVIR